jgi:hypothetical protein
MRGCKNLASVCVQSLLTAEGAEFCGGADKNQVLRSSASDKKSVLPKRTFVRPSASDDAALNRW